MYCTDQSIFLRSNETAAINQLQMIFKMGALSKILMLLPACCAAITLRRAPTNGPPLNGADAMLQNKVFYHFNERILRKCFERVLSY